MKLKGSLEQELFKFEKYVPLLEILIQTEFEERHWKIIQKIAKKDFEIEKLNIINISNYLENVDIELIRQVAKKAKKEKKIDKILLQIIDKFKKLKLNVDESNIKKRFDIKQLEQIENFLEEESIRLDRVINLKKEKYQKAGLIKIRRQLKKSLELVRIITKTQILLEELKVVFEGEEIRNSLANTWKKFEVEEREFRESLRAVEMTGNLESVIKTEGNPIFGLFLKLSNELKEIKEEVWNYLQSKRLKFPRFYSLNDQELFSLLKDYGSDSGIDTIEKFLPKMFLTVNSFIKNIQKKNIISGVGNNSTKNIQEDNEENQYCLNEVNLKRESLQVKEELKFNEEIEVQRFILEELMIKIEKNIEETLIKRVKSRLNAYMILISTNLEKKMKEFKNWIMLCTSQEVFICFSIILVKQLQTMKGHSKDFSVFESQLNYQISYLASLYSNNTNQQILSPKFLNLICFLSR